MRETTRNCFQVVPARSAESGHEKCDGKMTKHGIRINTLLARLFPVYGSRLRKEIGYVHGDEIYFASIRTRIIQQIETVIHFVKLQQRKENVLFFNKQ